MPSISLNLNFAGVVLPIVDCEDRHQRVPFKPLVEALGVEWARQYKKMQTPYFQRRMGTCIGDMYYAGQTREMVLIRVDRVCAWLNSLNPESIRAAGNEDAADFLEKKHEEWDNLIHVYEMRQGKLMGGSVKKALAIAQIERMKDARLKTLALAELGISWREAAANTPNPTGDLFSQSA